MGIPQLGNCCHYHEAPRHACPFNIPMHYIKWGIRKVWILSCMPWSLSLDRNKVLLLRLRVCMVIFVRECRISETLNHHEVHRHACPLHVPMHNVPLFWGWRCLTSRKRSIVAKYWFMIMCCTDNVPYGTRSSSTPTLYSTYVIIKSA